MLFPKIVSLSQFSYRNGQQKSTAIYKKLYKRYLSYSIMLLLKNGCLDNQQTKILKMSQNDRQKTIQNNLPYDHIPCFDKD